LLNKLKLSNFIKKNILRLKQRLHKKVLLRGLLDNQLMENNYQEENSRLL